MSSTANIPIPRKVAHEVYKYCTQNNVMVVFMNDPCAPLPKLSPTMIPSNMIILGTKRIPSGLRPDPAIIKVTPKYCPKFNILLKVASDARKKLPLLPARSGPLMKPTARETERILKHAKPSHEYSKQELNAFAKKIKISAKKIEYVLNNARTY